MSNGVKIANEQTLVCAPLMASSSGKKTDKLELMPVGKNDYLAALNTVSDGGWPGARIYDALLLNGAGRCPAEHIYTFNVADFGQLAPASLQSKICAP
jgi:hypothetical protein